MRYPEKRCKEGKEIGIREECCGTESRRANKINHLKDKVWERSPSRGGEPGKKNHLTLTKSSPRCVMSDRANSGWQIKGDEDEIAVLRLSPIFPILNSKMKHLTNYFSLKHITFIISKRC